MARSSVIADHSSRSGESSPPDVLEHSDAEILSRCSTVESFPAGYLLTSEYLAANTGSWTVLSGKVTLRVNQHNISDIYPGGSFGDLLLLIPLRQIHASGSINLHVLVEEPSTLEHISLAKLSPLFRRYLSLEKRYFRFVASRLSFRLVKFLPVLLGYSPDQTRALPDQPCLPASYIR